MHRCRAQDLALVVTGMPKAEVQPLLPRLLQLPPAALQPLYRRLTHAGPDGAPPVFGAPELLVALHLVRSVGHYMSHFC